MFRNIIFRRSIAPTRSLFTTTALRTPVKSSCPAGTVLNLRIKQKGDEPVALEDSEYPEWLWSMLDAEAVRDEIKNENFMRWRKIQLSKANNKRIRANNFLETMRK